MNLNGPVVDERVVRLVHDDALLREFRCTPSHLDALVVGYLHGEGRAADAELARALRIDDAGGIITIELPKPLPGIAKPFMRSAAGMLAVLDAEQFTALFRRLFSKTAEQHESGGMHAAALVDATRILYQAEDVGRHNAVDKAIGLALIDGADLQKLGMLITARVSGEIARKAAHSGVAWLASRSIPTTLAVRIAHDAGMPIIGRAAGKDAYLYT